MEPIQLEFTLDAEAYTRMMRNVAFQKRYWIIATGLVLYILSLAFRFKELEPPYYTLALPPLVIIGGYYFLFNQSIKRTYTFSTQLHHPLRYVFSEADISLESMDHQSTYQWEEFDHVREIKDWFLLYQNQVTFNPIPKSAFATPAEMEKFRALLAAKLQ